MDPKQDFVEVLKLFWQKLKLFFNDEILGFFTQLHILRHINRFLYNLQLLIQRFGKRVNRIVDIATLVVAVWCIGDLIWQLGFSSDAEIGRMVVWSNRQCIVFFGVVQIIKFLNYFNSGSRTPISEIIYAVGTWIYIYFSHSEDGSFYELLNHRYVIDAIVALLSVNEISRLGIKLLSQRSSPTLLFVGSFIFLILLGSGLLMMPRCHNVDISYFEALFTATSTVCVTGLSIIDMNEVLSPFGWIIILFLIQIGGIGVMTFTCFFAVSLNGSSSIQNQMVVRDLISAENMSDILTTLLRIFYVTVTIEIVGAWIIYEEIMISGTEMSQGDVIFTSVFHSVSAFCNAGVSNLDGGLNNELLYGNRYLYSMLALMAFIGGAGFPLQSSIIDWAKNQLYRIYCKLTKRSSGKLFRIRLIDANSRIFFFAHTSLLLIGAGIFFFSQMWHDESLSLSEQITDSFLLSAFSRSSGFVFRDITSFTSITLMFIAIFTWIGCSPLSTGGGVKVTTFAMMMLNLRGALFRKEDVEIFGRRISHYSLQRAFATVLLSIMAIIVSSIILKIDNPGISLSRLIYESNGALSTAGITFGLAEQLGTFSQAILMVDMFVGRIGILAFVLVFFTPDERQYYKYPTENIMI